MTMYETMNYEVENGVAIITLNRTQVLNAINRQMFAEWNRAFDVAAGDGGVRAILFAGAGRAFSAGHDMKEGAAERLVDPEDWRRVLKDTLDFGFKIWDCDKAVLAALHGYCLGQALQVALACDLIIAAKDATIGEPEVRQVTTSAFLMMPWIVGLQKSKELLLTGDTVSGLEAERMGLVNKAVEADQVLSETRKLAERIGKLPPAAVRLNKRAINKTYEIMGLRSAIGYNLEVLGLVHAIEAGTMAHSKFLEVQQSKGLKAALRVRDGDLSNG